MSKVLNFDISESTRESPGDTKNFLPTLSLKNKTSAKFLGKSIDILQSKISNQATRQREEESIFLIEPNKAKNIELDMKFLGKDEQEVGGAAEADGQKTPSFF